jgi:c-di-GMP-binding flagellar brake protein YcgR
MYLALAAGFSTSPVEIVIFFAILLLSVVIWVVTSLRRNRRESLRRYALAEEYYRELADSRGLSNLDRDLLDRLSRYTHNPRERFLLLQDQRVFNYAAARLLENEEDVSENQISALRFHTGFAGAPTGDSPRSTAEIPEGVYVELESRRRSPVPGKVLRHETSAIHVSVKDEDHRLTSGKPIRIIFRNSAGIFRFRSTVLVSRDGVLELSHSESVDRVQRRDHFRRSMRIPVQVQSACDGAEPTILDSQFVELGGNGGTIINPENRFSTDEEIALSFRPDEGDSLNLTATIVRTSQEGTLLHVRFVNVSDRDQDRVYRLLFAKQAGAGSTDSSAKRS